jgi:phosphohistidine phosphatase SixA
MSIFVVRHAHAGNRAAWHAEDRLRPLTEKGLRQAVGIAERLMPYHPRRLLASPHVRCVQTLEPLAAALGVAIEETADLAEGNAKRAVDLLRALIDEPSDSVALSTHGDIVAAILATLANEYGIDLGPAPLCEKGSIWHIRLEAGRPTGAAYIPSSSDP